MTKPRFNYAPWFDEGGNLLGTTITETGGYFSGIPPETLAAVAEGHYPKYSSGNMSETFHACYFNHTLRSKLRDLGVVEPQPEEVGSRQDSDTASYLLHPQL